MPKYIFVVGGVMSGVGKGVTSASIGKILQSRGFNVTAFKIDPYVNVDAGTMNPTEHGEVFILDDGMECDQDMGNYERFLNRTLTGKNYMTTGSVYKAVIEQERNLEYNGRCVEVVPHIPMEVIKRIDAAAANDQADIIIVEIGGTVGEYQNILFLEAVRMLKLKKPDDVLLVLVSFLPMQSQESELKTKPTQYAVRTINSVGLQPNIIIARAAKPLDDKRKEKIAFNCNIRQEDVISAPDVKSIYEVPIIFEEEKIGDVILKNLKLVPKTENLDDWRRLVLDIKNSGEPIKIAIVGKYFNTGEFILTDAYISVIEAIKHAAYANKKVPDVSWLNAEDFEKNPETLKILSLYSGVIIPGGFGGRGTEGKIAAIKYLRENKIPFLGLCYGMQMAVAEFSRNVAGLADANTTEVNPLTPYPVIDILDSQKENILNKKYGGTMRLGSYPAVLKQSSIARAAYGTEVIFERHRHRYEVNPKYIAELESKGLIFSGFSPDKRLMEIIELPEPVHPFFLATQFHPEFTSRPLAPNPLFKKFIEISAKKQ